MKTLPAAILLAAASFTHAEVTLPSAPDRQIYTETLAKSPFILETKVTDAPVAEKVSAFKDLYLRGIGKADGKDFVLLQRLGEERTMRFFGGEPGEDSLVVKTVKVGATFRETKVLLQKGSETGEVGFKEEAISAAPQQTIQVRPPGTPPQFNQFGNQARPPMPMVKGASPTGNPMVPRPQVMPSVQLPKPQGNMNVAPAYNTAPYKNGNAMKPGSPIRQTDPNRRIRTPVINN